MERETLCGLLPKDKGQAWTRRMKRARLISENGDFECRLVLREKPVQFLDHAPGILERGVFESYQRKNQQQERAFRVKLRGLVLSRKMKEQAGGGLC